jgi:phosphate:Na+ symporter
MQLAWFHVIFNVTTTLVLLPFIKQLVQIATKIIPEKVNKEETRHLKFVDDRLLSTPPVAIMQVKKEMDYMLSLVRENISLSFVAMENGVLESGDTISKNEDIIDFTNGALTRFLISLSSRLEESDENVIGSYFHVLNDLERIGDHAENFYEIGEEMQGKGLVFSDIARQGMDRMRGKIMTMLEIATDAFETLNKDRLSELSTLEGEVDDMKKELVAGHFTRLADGECTIEVSPYYSSAIAGLERVADHLVNVGYSILNPTGDQKEKV